MRTTVMVVAAMLFAASASAQWTEATNANDIRNTNSGNVGIGTSAPAAKLHVTGSAMLQLLESPSGAAYLSGGNANGPADGKYSYMGFASNVLTWGKINDELSSPTEFMRLDGIGRLGIGTSSPAAKLQVNGTGVLHFLQSASGVAYLTGGNADGPADGKYSYTGFASNVVTWGKINDGLSSPTEFMRLDGIGRLGIGTTNPAELLHVAGNIHVDGNINAKYQDIAEWVASPEPLAAGTVVIIAPRKVNEVVASTDAYDTRVAGVVSAQPGLILGEASASKVMIATTGRVRVKVDATAAPIEAGDLLVSSATRGLAMKSAPVDVGGVTMHRPGTVIGKALEPLASGEGEILVLLSLQ